MANVDNPLMTALHSHIPAVRVEALKTIAAVIEYNSPLDKLSPLDLDTLVNLVQYAFATVFHVVSLGPRASPHAATESEAAFELVMALLSKLYCGAGAASLGDERFHLQTALFVNELLQHTCFVATGGEKPGVEWSWELKRKGVDALEALVTHCGPRHARLFLPGLFTRCCRTLAVEDARRVLPRPYVERVCDLLTSIADAAIPPRELQLAPGTESSLEGGLWVSIKTAASAKSSQQPLHDVPRHADPHYTVDATVAWLEETSAPLHAQLQRILEVKQLSSFYDRADVQPPIPLLRFCAILLARFCTPLFHHWQNGDAARRATLESRGVLALCRDVVVAIGVLVGDMGEPSGVLQCLRDPLAHQCVKAVLGSMLHDNRSVERGENDPNFSLQASHILRALPGLVTVVRELWPLACAEVLDGVSSCVCRLFHLCVRDCCRVFDLRINSDLALSLARGSVQASAIGPLRPIVAMLRLLSDVVVTRERAEHERHLFVEHVRSKLEDWECFAEHPATILCVSLLFAHAPVLSSTAMDFAEDTLRAVTPTHVWNVREDAERCNAQQLRFRHELVALVLLFMQNVSRRIPSNDGVKVKGAKKRFDRWMTLCLYEVVEKVPEHDNIQSCSLTTLSVFAAVYRELHTTGGSSATLSDSAALLIAYSDLILDGALRGVEYGDDNAPQVMQALLSVMCFGRYVNDVRDLDNLVSRATQGTSSVPFAPAMGSVSTDALTLVAAAANRVLARLHALSGLDTNRVELLVQMLDSIVTVVARTLKQFDGLKGLRLGEQDADEDPELARDEGNRQDRTQQEPRVPMIVRTLEKLLMQILDETRGVLLGSSAPVRITVKSLAMSASAIEALRIYTVPVAENCGATPSHASSRSARNVSGGVLPTLHKLYQCVVTLMLPARGFTLAELVEKHVDVAVTAFEAPAQTPATRRTLAWAREMSASPVTVSALTTLTTLFLARTDFMEHRTTTDVLRVVKAWALSVRLRGPPWALQERKLRDAIDRFLCAVEGNHTSVCAEQSAGDIDWIRRVLFPAVPTTPASDGIDDTAYAGSDRVTLDCLVVDE